ncbi:MAG: MmgE/PrpD family protein, partial [Halobacteriota archaeon]
MSQTAALAKFVAESSLDDVPEPVREKATEAIADLVGVAIYGSHHEVGEKVASYVETASPGTDATVLGRGTASPSGAALANGSFGHAVDFDDTFESIVLHPTSPVFCAALAAAEADGATGPDVLEAYVLGLD